MKEYLIHMLLAVTVLAEPPIENRYLPPSDGYRTTNQDNFAPPSQTYGTPEQFAPQRQTDAVFRNRPSLSNGTPQSRPSPQYGPPAQFTQNRPSPSFRGQSQPSTQYGPPQFNQNKRSQNFQNRQNQPSSQYGPPSQFSQSQRSQFAQTPSSQYGPPQFNQNQRSQFAQNQRSQFTQSQRPQFAQNQRPQFNQNPSSPFGQNQPSSQYNAPMPRQPSIEYGTPSQSGYPMNSGGSFASGGQDLGYPRSEEQNRKYLPPNRRNGYNGDDESNNEPANYSFEYMVKDEESGNDFGHRESRMGDRAEGLYYVLLPDGRKQMVEYEADQDGYKPKISYEDTGLSQSNGYDRNSQNQGYQNDQSYPNGQSGPY